MRRALVVVVVLTCAVLLQMTNRKKATPQPGSFTDILKNPELSKDMAEGHEEQKALIRDAVNWPDEKVRSEVRSAVLEALEQFGLKMQVLRTLGPRTDAPVLEILTDKSLRATLRMPSGEGFMKTTPLEVACGLVLGHAPEKLVEPLLPFAEDADPGVRKTVAHVLGCAATASATPALKNALQDSSKEVREEALRGLREAKKVAPECRDALFESVRLLTLHGIVDGAASALLALDSDKALEFFASDSYCRLETAGLREALYAMAKQKKTLPRAQLLKLNTEVQSQPVGPFDTGPRRYILTLLARHRDPLDNALFESAIHNSNDTLAEAAADGYLVYHGQEDALEQAYETEKAHEWAGLSQPQRYYVAVLELDEEVCNGGLSQYFVNSGDRWPDALAGLGAMGLKESQSNLQKELDKFGPKGPSVDRETRMNQLATIINKEERAFHGYDTAFFKRKEITAASAVYVVKNAEAFK